jgi:hypothetical protein
MRFEIKKNNNISTGYDQRIREIEGTYDSQKIAIAKFKTVFGTELAYSVLPDGMIWVYDPKMTAVAIMADTFGHQALASIEVVEAD